MNSESPQKKRFYTLALTIQTLDVRESAKGPYAELVVTYVPTTGHNAGRTQTVSAVCVGRAYETVRDDLVTGDTIKVYGQFEKADDPSQPQTFRIVGKATARSEAEATPTMLVNGVSVPVSEYNALLDLMRTCPTIGRALTAPVANPVQANAQAPHVIAGVAVPFLEHKEFQILMARTPALRRALQA